jgi:hypothetical protein
MPLKTLVLVVVCLIVGLAIGFGAGALIVQPVTKTSVITETKPVTVTQTQTLTERRIETQTLTMTRTQTLHEVATIYATKEVTVTMTTMPLAQCKIREECEEKGLAVIVHGMERRDSLGIFKPGEGNDYLILDITIRNKLGVEISYSQFFMSVKDEYERVYPASPVVAVALTGYLPGGGTLRPGESVRGYVCFEVPKTSQNFIFRYSDLTRIIIITLY